MLFYEENVLFSLWQIAGLVGHRKKIKHKKYELPIHDMKK